MTLVSLRREILQLNAVLKLLLFLRSAVGVVIRRYAGRPRNRGSILGRRKEIFLFFNAS